MRNVWITRAAALTLTVLAIVGCDDSQPDRSQARTASVTLSARAQYFLYECWDIFDNSSGTEVDTGYHVCDQTTQQEIRAVPWRYTISISVVLKGATTEQVVTSLDGKPGSSVETGDSVPDYVSMTPFDPIVEQPGTQKPPDGSLVFRNGQKVSVGSQRYLHDLNYQVPGSANILNSSPTFDFAVSSGDTIIVRARKQSLTDSPGFLIGEQDVPSLTLSATLFVGGTPVTPNGATSSDFSDKTGFTFSYTVP